MARSAPEAAGQTAADEPGTGFDPGWEPSSLADLIAATMERDGYTRLLTMVNARKSRINYSTIWSWYSGDRARKRPPTRKLLTMFAEDFNLPLPLVLKAAGLDDGDEPELSDDEKVIVHLYQELTPQDREFAERMLRDLAERKSNQRTTRG